MVTQLQCVSLSMRHDFWTLFSENKEINPSGTRYYIAHK